MKCPIIPTRKYCINKFKLFERIMREMRQIDSLLFLKKINPSFLKDPIEMLFFVQPVFVYLQEMEHSQFTMPSDEQMENIINYCI